MFFGSTCASLILVVVRADISILSVDLGRTDYTLTQMAFARGILAAIFGTIAVISPCLHTEQIVCLSMIIATALLTITFAKNDWKIEGS